VVQPQRVSSGCARGMPSRDRAVAARDLCHAPKRAACGTVVARVAAWGAVGGVCDRAVAACGDTVMYRGVWPVAPSWRG